MLPTKEEVVILTMYQKLLVSVTPDLAAFSMGREVVAEKMEVTRVCSKHCC